MGSVLNAHAQRDGDTSYSVGIAKLLGSESSASPADQGALTSPCSSAGRGDSGTLIIRAKPRRPESTPSGANPPSETAVDSSLGAFGRVGKAAKRIGSARVGPLFQLLQKWEGEVESVGGESFSARLFDVTTPTMPEEVASFDLEELAQEDRLLVAPGAVFYWSMGYQEETSGQKKRVSFIRFRRLPSWTAREVADLHRLDSSVAEFFGDGRGEQERSAG